MGLMDDVDAITTPLAFCSADAFMGVETFKLHRAGKATVSVTGPVYRDPAQLMSEFQIMERGLVIFVASSFVTSIDSSADAVEIAFDYGGKAERHAVKDILKQDAGGWLLLVG